MRSLAKAPTWPGDADGDALRRIWLNDNVDFDVEHLVDFQIDFKNWPFPEEALNRLRKEFGTIRIVAPSADGCGYVEISRRMRLDYGEIVSMQKKLTALLSRYGGVCECWGMMATP